MVKYKIVFYVKSKKRSTLIEVFSSLRDHTRIGSKKDRNVLKAIANDNMDIEIVGITREGV